ncbi:hypothetical protein [Streptomyces sp. UH6]|uniref:hypothetical protein n=1 Tax=Streptomyces sp. UH6 TaxID=2748379 RepID=UPI0015D4E7B4|nr:hypothetical protein [Streptomyces sp. UH6]NYV75241.1 hypothetical protein [Streptomyces sp. UH6]
MGIKDQFQDKAERLQQEANQRAGQRRDDAGDRSPSRDRSPQHEDDRSRRPSSQDDVYDDDTI